MELKILTTDDVEYYIEDIYECYADNLKIFDNQNPLGGMNKEGICNFVKSFCTGGDSLVFAVTSGQFLYGLYILDNIRYGAMNKSCGEVHMALSRHLWGKQAVEWGKKFLKVSPVSTLYCMIPSCCPAVIKLCKDAGFKKTGYIPNALPYKPLNSMVDKLYDIQILTYQREDK